MMPVNRFQLICRHHSNHKLAKPLTDENNPPIGQPRTTTASTISDHVQLRATSASSPPPGSGPAAPIDLKQLLKHPQPPPISATTDSSNSDSRESSFFSAYSCGHSHSPDSRQSVNSSAEEEEEKAAAADSSSAGSRQRPCSSSSSCYSPSCGPANSSCADCCSGQGSEQTEETLKQQRRASSRLSSGVTTPIQQPLFVQTELDRINATNVSKGCACEECQLSRQLSRQRELQQQEHATGHQQMAGPSAGGRVPGMMGSSGPATSSSGISQQQQMLLDTRFCNGPTTVTQTIEEQIKQIDRISKECDNSRKNLEAINRRLDDLNDEVRRYREFLGHEKTRRDPALYKTASAEPMSAYNDSICRLIDSLTCQLTLEWTEKLRSIQNQTISKFANEKG